ncbi:hypothetical protein GH714_028986 [Hevea brasiliensis]|uniref:Uncharacterized protein n=1 Tax=Hevea brasiliensis TaxID=3981 RepID=A0A6A6LH15_HEVBR|nr:hypothetical protein GH714_028986 [Hevea brasiliensis]
MTTVISLIDNVFCSNRSNLLEIDNDNDELHGINRATFKVQISYEDNNSDIESPGNATGEDTLATGAALQVSGVKGDDSECLLVTFMRLGELSSSDIASSNACFARWVRDTNKTSFLCAAAPFRPVGRVRDANYISVLCTFPPKSPVPSQVPLREDKRDAIFIRVQSSSRSLYFTLHSHLRHPSQNSSDPNFSKTLVHSSIVSFWWSSFLFSVEHPYSRVEQEGDRCSGRPQREKEEI